MPARRTDASSEGFNGGTVTALKVRRGRSDRTVVFIDGEAVVEIATVIAEEAQLRTGMVLVPEDLDSLRQRDEPFRARSKALVLLTARDRPVREIETRLDALGFSAETVSATIAWLRERGYVDDHRYAEHFAAEKIRAGWARRRIRSDLLARGISRDVAEEVVASIETRDGMTESDADQVLVEKLVRRFGAEYACDPAGTRRRIAGFLARRGYDWDSVDRVMRRFETGDTTGVGTE